MNTIEIAKEIVEEFTIGDIGDELEGWVLLERGATGEWRHGNTYRFVVCHPQHGYFDYRWRDQQDGEWSSINSAPDPTTLYRVEPVEVTVTQYRRVAA